MRADEERVLQGLKQHTANMTERHYRYAAASWRKTAAASSRKDTPTNYALWTCSYSERWGPFASASRCTWTIFFCHGGRMLFAILEDSFLTGARTRHKKTWCKTDGGCDGHSLTCGCPREAMCRAQWTPRQEVRWPVISVGVPNGSRTLVSADYFDPLRTTGRGTSYTLLSPPSILFTTTSSTMIARGRLLADK